jgi:hypothetical protein
MQVDPVEGADVPIGLAQLIGFYREVGGDRRNLPKT